MADSPRVGDPSRRRINKVINKVTATLFTLFPAYGKNPIPKIWQTGLLPPNYETARLTDEVERVLPRPEELPALRREVDRVFGHHGHGLAAPLGDRGRGVELHGQV